MRHPAICLIFLGLLPAVALGLPVIKIKEPAEASAHRIGTPLKVVLEVKDVSFDYSVGLFIQSNLPVRERGENPPPEGPLFPLSSPITSTTEQLIYWPGNTLGCGQPEACPVTMPEGRYRIEVVLYKKHGVPLGKPSDHVDDIILRLKSAEFQLGTTEDTQTIAPVLKKAARIKLLQLLDFGDTSVEFLDSLLIGHLITLPTSGSEYYCQTFALNEPFEGALKVCAAKNSDLPIKAGGKASPQHGLMPFHEARETALRIVRERYKARVDFLEIPPATQVKDPGLLNHATSLDASVYRWGFSRVQKHWNFHVRATKRGGSQKGPDRFDDIVFLEIGRKRPPCLSAVLPFSKGSSFDLSAHGDRCLN